MINKTNIDQELRDKIIVAENAIKRLKAKRVFLYYGTFALLTSIFITTLIIMDGVKNNVFKEKILTFSLAEKNIVLGSNHIYIIFLRCQMQDMMII